MKRPQTFEPLRDRPPVMSLARAQTPPSERARNTNLRSQNLGIMWRAAGVSYLRGEPQMMILWQIGVNDGGGLLVV